MKKKIWLSLVAVFIGVLLVGCGKKTLTVKDHQINPSGLAAVVKGNSNQKHVSYTIDGGNKQTVKVKNGAFAVVIPAKPTDQKVKVSAANLKQTVTVNKAKVLIKYPKLSVQYNEAITASELSKADQKKAKEVQAKGAALKKQQASLQSKAAKAKKQLASGDTSAASDLQDVATQGKDIAAQGQALKADGQKVKKAMKRAKAKVKDRLMPSKISSGVHNLITTKNLTIRANVANDKVTGIAIMVPIKSLKSVKKATGFGTSFAVLSNTVGADAKKIMKEFQDKAKSKDKNSTTTKTLHSNGIDFDMGYSTTTLYIYVTKAK
ncbi:hypothetical protein [Lentilactobacillus sp. Marseille-Q4993]|uniref:hypothetical protein n=1 Tax=Lentilactobacillus sp. Marseille-Q4993 TaxID=3039492 RepID=UPI0024BD5537|nr:hypothetical protein [Lentilactobacillus sp. Marseille-Q4993]